VNIYFITNLNLTEKGIKMEQQLNRKSGQFVVPGEYLGVIEEFIPNSETYVENGRIYSKIIGHTLIDFLNKRISVYPLGKKTKIPKVGDIIFGQVANVQSQNALIRIFKMENKSFPVTFKGLLHVSDTKVSYVKSMFNICKPGDILRAQIISIKNSTFHLSTKEKELGVVYAFCSQCGDLLLKPKRQRSSCPKCKNIEKKKTALDYGKVII
jgi:exosome complex component CSL4